VNIQNFVKNLPERQTIEISAKARVFSFARVMGGAFQQLRAFSVKNGLEISGPPFVRYTDVDWVELANKHSFLYTLKHFFDIHNLSVGFFVDRKTTSEGEVESRSFPAGNYLEFEHQGPYRGLTATYKQYISEAIRNKLALRSENMECYLNSPQTVPSAELKTLIQVPVIDE